MSSNIIEHSILSSWLDYSWDLLHSDCCFFAPCTLILSYLLTGCWWHKAHSLRQYVSPKFYHGCQATSAALLDVSLPAVCL